MSNLTDILAADLGRTAFLGSTDDPMSPLESVTYTPKGGSGSTISIAVMPEEIDDRPAARGRDHDVAIRRAIVQASDVASPTIGDTFTLETVDWVLDSVEEANAAAWIGVFKKSRRHRLATGGSTTEAP